MNEDENEINAAIAGQLLSSWLPSGLLRRCIFLAAIAVGFYGIIFDGGAWYGFLFILIACVMSPRIVGWIAYFSGKISNKN